MIFVEKWARSGHSFLQFFSYWYDSSIVHWCISSFAFLSLLRWLVQDVDIRSTWITNRKQVSQPVCHNIASMQDLNRRIRYSGRQNNLSICIKSRGRVWIAVQLDKVQSPFPKNGRCWSVWLSSPLQPWAFSFISLTKTLFPRQLTTAINWLVAAVSDCVTLSSSSATGPLPPVISSGMVPEICSRLFCIPLCL